MMTIVRMMDHLYWANGRLLQAMDRGCATEQAIGLMRHVAVAEQVWLCRLEGRSSAHLKLWGEAASLTDVAELLRDGEHGFRHYVSGLTEERLDDVVDYRNQSGAPFRTSIRDILAHVALHGQYHRGQINRMLREQGAEPAALDYILYSRLTDNP